jgi:hypothetical protein
MSEQESEDDRRTSDTSDTSAGSSCGGSWSDLLQIPRNMYKAFRTRFGRERDVPLPDGPVVKPLQRPAPPGGRRRQAQNRHPAYERNLRLGSGAAARAAAAAHKELADDDGGGETSSPLQARTHTHTYEKSAGPLSASTPGPTMSSSTAVTEWLGNAKKEG